MTDSFLMILAKTSIAPKFCKCLSICSWAERRGSLCTLCAHRKELSEENSIPCLHEYSVEFFRVLCLNAFKSLECLNGQVLKTVQMISFHAEMQQ